MQSHFVEAVRVIGMLHGELPGDFGMLRDSDRFDWCFDVACFCSFTLHSLVADSRFFSVDKVGPRVGG